VTYRSPGQDEPDVVGFGSERRPRRPWIYRGVVGAAVLVAAGLVVAHVAGERNAAAKGRPPPVILIHVGHRLLGATTGWEVVARGPRSLVIIQPSTGAVVQTAVPPLLSNNPEVALLVQPHRVIIRSYDEVPGYVVPDGGEARLLTGPLADNSPGPLLPGPQAGQAWVLLAPDQLPQGIGLVNAAGRLTRTTIRQPAFGSMAATAIADGRGYVLLLDESNGVYDAGPTWYRKIDAELVAVGPTRWLGFLCSGRHCGSVTIDAATGAMSNLPGPGVQAAFAWPTLGVTSPDGSTAAVPIFGQDGGVTLRLISLVNGSSQSLPVTLSSYAGYQFMAFSPDGRWLFVISAQGKLLAVSVRTGKVTGFGIRLPALSQVAIRPAPAATTAP
jgi:hypothetical protein